MIAALLRLFALRPILAGSLLGIPILTLLALGLFTVVLFKVLLFVVLPLTLAWLFIRSIRRHRADETQTL
jgi:uncharacterized membrane protein YvlD (DUF360 family)